MIHADILGVLVGGAALVVSIWAAIRQLSLARQSNIQSFVLDAFREYRSPDMVACRRYVRNEFTSEGYTATDGVSGLPDNVRPKVQRISHYCDQLGLCQKYRLIELGLICDFMGESILRVWGKLKPFIDAEKINCEYDYQRNFRELAERIAKARPDLAELASKDSDEAARNGDGARIAKLAN